MIDGSLPGNGPPCTIEVPVKTTTCCLVPLAVLLASTPAAAQAPRPWPPDYLVAVGAGAALGPVGWGTEIGSLLEVSSRVQPLPWLGAGAAFLQLSASNNEGYPSLLVNALEVNASAHPYRTRWLDPFVRVGGVRVLNARDGYPGDIALVSRWGAEVLGGLDVAATYFALGIDLRHGFTNRSWTMAGLHVEARLPLF